MTTKKRWLLGGGLAAVALAATLSGGVVLADTGGAPTPTNIRATLRQEFRGHLASDLNVSDDQLNAAVTQAAQQTVDDAVADGTLTQEQGDNLKAKIADGDFAGLFGARHPRLLRAAIGADIAKQLDITPAELKSELDSGKTLKDIITAHGKTVDEVVNGVVSDAQTRLNARESKLLDLLRQRLTNAINTGTLPSQQTTPATPTS